MGGKKTTIKKPKSVQKTAAVKPLALTRFREATATHFRAASQPAVEPQRAFAKRER
jgi:hypothetical protein